MKRSWLLGLAILVPYALWLGHRYRQSGDLNLWLAVFENPTLTDEKRATAAIFLGEMIPKSETALRALEAGLNDSNVMVRRAAAHMLWKQRDVAKPGFTVLAEALEDPDYLVCRRVIEILGDYGQSARAAVPQLVGLMERPEPEVKESILANLWKIDPEDERLGIALAQGVSDADGKVQRLALKLSFRVKAMPAEAFDALVGAATTANQETRTSIVQILAKMGRNDLMAYRRLEGQAKNSDTSRSALALDALGRMGGKAKSSVPLLLEVYQKQTDTLREHALTSLWRIGVVSPPVQDPLEAIESRNGTLRREAVLALRYLRNRKQAVEALIRLLEDSDLGVQENAAIALRGCRKDALPAIAALEKLTNRRVSKIVRKQAAITLEYLKGL